MKLNLKYLKLKKLLSTTINKMTPLREIWNESTIVEETEDQWGRKGRGITIYYLNPKLANKKYISEEEYLGKVKEFDKFIQEYKKNPIFKIEDFEREFKEIFGDFEK